MDRSEKFNSRFGYLMVAVGAAVALGNIWKFLDSTYRGGSLYLAIFLNVFGFIK